MATAKAKTTTTARPKEPTREEYRDWYWEQQRVAVDLRHELAMARATISAQAYALAYGPLRRNALDTDIPF